MNTTDKIIKEFRRKYCFKEYYSDKGYIWQLRQTAGGIQEFEDDLKKALKQAEEEGYKKGIETSLKAFNVQELPKVKPPRRLNHNFIDGWKYARNKLQETKANLLSNLKEK